MLCPDIVCPMIVCETGFETVCTNELDQWGCEKCDCKQSEEEEEVVCPRDATIGGSCERYGSDAECSVGEECCCGKCHASMRLMCDQTTKTWFGYNTDYCMNPLCDIVCPPIMCTMHCENGFKQGEDGCDICECADIPVIPDCPEVMCTMYCEHGYIKGQDGCDTCTCADAPVTPECLPGGWCDISSSDEMMSIWERVLAEHLNREYLRENNLMDIGQPSSGSTQVVRGSNYKFNFPCGAQIS